MVNTIAGANILYDVGDGHLPETVAVLIIGLVAIIVGLFGYKIVVSLSRPTSDHDLAFSSQKSYVSEVRRERPLHYIISCSVIMHCLLTE